MWSGVIDGGTAPVTGGATHTSTEPSVPFLVHLDVTTLLRIALDGDRIEVTVFHVARCTS
jgi:hypothetical protein